VDADLRARVLEEIRDREVLDLACRLVKIPSENPPGDVGEVAAFIEEYLSSAGIGVERHEPAPGKISLIARIGRDSGRELVFNGHMDVVPAGDRSRWGFDPFLGEVRDGYLLGRGASDMKGGLAGMVYAFLKLADHEDQLNGRLTLTCVPDEETGGEYGTGYLVSRNIAIGSSAVIAEPTGIGFIDIGQKGALWLRVTVYGRPAHGSLSPYAGESAILKAADLIRELLTSITKLSPRIPGDLKPIIRESREAAERLLGIRGVGKIIDHATINFGVIRGGTKINVVPESCEVEVDIRVPIGLTTDQIASRVEEVVSRYGGEVVYLQRSQPNYTSPNSEIVKIAAKNVERLTGVSPRLFVQWASSDARFYRMRGVPTIHYGPAELHTIHGYDERVRADEVVKACKVYAGIAADYLGSI